MRIPESVRQNYHNSLEKPEHGHARWFSEAVIAAAMAGYGLEEYKGRADYQGSGALLLRKGDWNSAGEWAVLQWDYGSCSGSDGYEGASMAFIVGGMTKDITEFGSESDARLFFDNISDW